MTVKLTKYLEHVPKFFDGEKQPAVPKKYQQNPNNKYKPAPHKQGKQSAQPAAQDETDGAQDDADNSQHQHQAAGARYELSSGQS